MTQEPEKTEISKHQPDKQKAVFFKRYWHTLTLLLALIIVSLTYHFDKSSLKRKHKEQVETVTKTYEKKLDSLTVSNIKTVAKVFTWAIRSEQFRENYEEIDFLLQAIVKQHGYEEAAIIDPVNATMIKGTDKKKEGEVQDYSRFGTITDLASNQPDSNTIEIVNPVFGINNIMSFVYLRATL